MFSESWKNHRGRKQKHKQLPVGVPNYIFYAFPGNYGGKKCGHNVKNKDLQEFAELSGLLDEHDDYLPPSFRQQCEQHVQGVELI